MFAASVAGAFASSADPEYLEVDDGVLANHRDLVTVMTRLKFIRADRDGPHLNASALAAGRPCDAPPASDCRTFVLGRPVLLATGDVGGGRDAMYSAPIRVRTGASGALGVAVARAGILRCRDARDVSRVWHGTADYAATAYVLYDGTGNRPRRAFFPDFDYACPKFPIDDRRGSAPFTSTLWIPER